MKPQSNVFTIDELFDVSGDLLCIMDLNKKFYKTNACWEEKFGWTFQNLSESSYMSFVHPDDIKKTEHAIEYSLANVTSRDFENRYRYKEGHYAWIHWRVKCRRDGTISAQGKDISWFKEIKHDHDEIVKLPEQSPQPIFRLSYNREFMFSNMATHDLFAAWEKGIPAEIWDTFEKAIECNKAMTLRIPAGKQFFSLEFVPLSQERYVNIYGTNITELKRAEKRLTRYTEKLAKARLIAENATAAKSVFLANMSHEIRTPMNGVIGTASLLADEKLDKKQKLYVETIIHSGEALLQIVNEILDFSKIESGKSQLFSAPFNLYKCLDNICHLLKPVASEKSLEFDLTYDATLPEFVTGDEGRIRQVIINLVNNAIKFTEKGSVHADLSVENKTDDSVTIKISINDTGPGIAMEKQKEIFSAFTQADSSTTRKAGGTGLGLSISKSFVEMMDGTIGVVSKEGKGSTFWFIITVPLAAEEDVPRAPDLSSVALLNGGNNLGMRVLLAEDVKTNQLVITDMLKRFNCQADIAENGEEVLTLSRRKKYDVILMDCHMPVMDGYDATRSIRESNDNRNWDTPIIALTANVLKEDRDKCFSSGMDDFMTKPLKKEDILAILCKWRKEDPLGESESENDSLDRETVEDLFRSFGDNAIKIVEMAMVESEKFVDRMGDSLRQGDRDTFGVDAHSLKSISKQIGAMKLSEYARTLERKANNNDLENAESLYDQLAHEFVLVKERMLQEIRKFC